DHTARRRMHGRTDRPGEVRSRVPTLHLAIEDAATAEPARDPARARCDEWRLPQPRRGMRLLRHGPRAPRLGSNPLLDLRRLRPTELRRDRELLEPVIADCNGQRNHLFVPRSVHVSDLNAKLNSTRGVERCRSERFETAVAGHVEVQRLAGERPFGGLDGRITAVDHYAKQRAFDDALGQPADGGGYGGALRGGDGQPGLRVGLRRTCEEESAEDHYSGDGECGTNGDQALTRHFVTPAVVIGTARS